MSQSMLSHDAEISPPDSLPDVAGLGPRLIRGGVVALVISILVYGGLLLRADLRLVMRGFEQWSAPYLTGLFGINLVHVALRCVRWEYYLRRLGVRTPKFESVLICVAGFAMSLSPGKLGEVLKSVLLQRSTGAPIVRTAPVVFAERLTDVTGLTILCALALGVAMNAWVAGASLVLGVFALGLVMNCRGLGRWVIDVVSSPKRLRRFRPQVQQVFDTTLELTSLRAYCVGTLLSMGAWGAHGVVLACAASAFPGVELGILPAQLAYGGPLLAGTLAMLPGGVGLTEATMTGAIVRLGGPGASLSEATLITLVVRGVTFWATMTLGVAALLLWRLARRTRATHLRS